MSSINKIKMKQHYVQNVQYIKKNNNLETTTVFSGKVSTFPFFFNLISDLASLWLNPRSRDV